jgi:hypothetical protein
MNNFSTKQLSEIRAFFDSIQLEFLNVNDFMTDADWQSLDLNKDTYSELNNFLEFDSVFDINIIGSADAIAYLKENDPTLKRSLELADELGYKTDKIGSELLASLLATRKTVEAFCELHYQINEFFNNLIDYTEALHQEARDLMDAINDAHKWDSQLSLDEYLMTHFDGLSDAEINDIKTLLDKFDNL